MPSIDHAWRDYFDNPHEGLGSTYERFILHRLFEGIEKKYKVRKVLEAPSFGMTGISGINSMWWGRRGAEVTVADHDPERVELAGKVWGDMGFPVDFALLDGRYDALPFGEDSFDLGWNFAAIGCVGDLDAFLHELARVTRNAIWICVPNPTGIGFLARRALEAGSEGGSRTANADLGRIRAAMERLGWSKAEEGFFDVPPWPDIAMKKEDLFRKIGIHRLLPRPKEGTGRVLTILDYFNGANPGMEEEMMRYSLLEGAPWIVKKLWAHHQYMIFTPGGGQARP